MVLFTFTRCEEVIDARTDVGNPDLIVVEGIITNERINHKIKLTRPYQTQNETPARVSGAFVRITNGTDTLTLTESPALSGEYYTPKVRAVTRQPYTLIIETDGKQFLATDSSEPVEPLSPLEVKKLNGELTLVLNESGTEANFIDYNINWKNSPACTGDECAGKVVFYDLKTIDVNEMYKPKEDKFTFPERSVVIRKKYSVSPAFKAYLRAMMSETRWRGGVFDVERDNVPTNFNEGATGFFAVSTVISDTTVINL